MTRILIAIAAVLFLGVTDQASAASVFRLKADCAVIGDGVADDTAAIQACIANAQVSGGVIIAEIGDYKTTSCLSVTKTITIQGQGYAGHRQYPAAINASVFRPTANFLCVASNTPVFLERFQIHYAPGVNTAKGIILDGSGGTLSYNTDSIIRDVFIINANQCVVSVNVSRLRFDNNTLEGCGQVSMITAHVANPDGGDSFIANNTFSGQPTFAHLLYISGGALRIINNKFNGGGNAAIYILPDPCSGNPPLAGFGGPFITGNSIEGTPYGMIVQQQPGCENARLDLLHVVGNEFGATLKGIWFRDGSISGGWIRTVTVGLNTFIGMGATNSIVIDPNSVTNTQIGLNAIH